MRYIAVKGLTMKSPSKYEASPWGGLQMKIEHEKKPERKQRRRQ